MSRDILIVVVGVALLGLVWIGWQQFTILNINDGHRGPVACTADAKMCPDGSYVGRVGPNCEFAACPGEEI